MAFLVMASGVAGLWALSPWIGKRATDIMREGLTFGRDAAFDEKAMGNTFVHLSWEALTLLSPIFLLTVAAALLTPFLLGGWLFSPKSVALNFERLDPLSGIKRMFSMQSVGELVKAVLKSLLIGGVIWWVVRHEMDHLFALISQPIDAALVSFVRMLLFASLALVCGLAIIAMLDVPFQLWQYYAKLRMTKEEVRQEYKEMEGDPQLKARIRAQQREMSRKRMMSEVPNADVVVTNPTHYAVALKYDSGAMGAPQVVAKGMNLIAQNIRELASANNVPVLEAPPLARALYRHAEVGDQIPAALYTAVAEVMAYVYQLNQYLAGGAKLPPDVPKALPVPADLDPGAAD